MILGIDTSNYTTSAALYDGERVVQRKRPLTVKPGELGLRQSDALFRHTMQLPELLEELLADAGGSIAAVGVSDRPRAVEGSYMPCFLAGVSVARSVAAAMNIPLRSYSHQQGHLAAALFSAGRMELLREEFLALHVSGGTTELLLVRPELQAEILGGTADLNAGQLADRVGVMLGFAFPAGKALDDLARGGQLPRKLNPSVEGMTGHFSGLENQCRQMRGEGVPPPDIARHCLESVAEILVRIAGVARERHGGLPLVCSGGVCCSEVLRARVREAYPEACFAEPDYSADNAAGLAVLAGEGI